MITTNYSCRIGVIYNLGMLLMDSDPTTAAEGTQP
jgi:hypothetical protein